CLLFRPPSNHIFAASFPIAPPDYRRLACAWLILRSIQRSRMVLRSFQRLPSLNAGISPSVMYRYRVSGEIPRYCEACRTFITSRDSFTRNATPALELGLTPEFPTTWCTPLPPHGGAPRVKVMASASSGGQRDSLGLLP